MAIIKFNLLVNGYSCKTLDELREHYKYDDLLRYLKSGKMLKWLKAHKYEDKFSALKQYDFNNLEDKEIKNILEAILGLKAKNLDISTEKIYIPEKLEMQSFDFSGRTILAAAIFGVNHLISVTGYYPPTNKIERKTIDYSVLDSGLIVSFFIKSYKKIEKGFFNDSIEILEELWINTDHIKKVTNNRDSYKEKLILTTKETTFINLNNYRLSISSDNRFLFILGDIVKIYNVLDFEELATYNLIDYLEKYNDFTLLKDSICISDDYQKIYFAIHKKSPLNGIKTLSLNTKTKELSELDFHDSTDDSCLLRLDKNNLIFASKSYIFKYDIENHETLLKTTISSQYFNNSWGFPKLVYIPCRQIIKYFFPNNKLYEILILNNNLEVDEAKKNQNLYEILFPSYPYKLTVYQDKKLTYLQIRDNGNKILCSVTTNLDFGQYDVISISNNSKYILFASTKTDIIKVVKITWKS